MNNHENTNPALRCVRAAARVALLAMTMMASGSLAGTASAQDAGDDETVEESTLRVDIQTATEAELTQLPGIGPSKAQAIIAHRERVPFRRIEDLMRVRGIGRATFRRLRSMLTVGPEAAPDRGARARRGRRAEAPQQ